MVQCVVGMYYMYMYVCIVEYVELVLLLCLVQCDGISGVYQGHRLQDHGAGPGGGQDRRPGHNPHVHVTFSTVYTCCRL